MKTRIIKLLVVISFLGGLLSACSKESALDVSIINYDTYEPSEIDNWIARNLTDPYNIEVIYRYSRDQHDLNRNISPPDESKVIPQMRVVIEGFLKVYEKVGGKTFVKVYSPKQFVLFGSHNYRDDGVVIAGTADGGRRITLYGLNYLDTTSANSVLGNLGTVHHEFTHILNQIRTIPPDFELVSVGDYFANWTDNTQNPESLSRSLGFISRYARSSVGEDFAEMLSTLVVEGQAYFDKYAYDSGQEGFNKLKAKESIVRDYLMSNFNIDLNELQYEFAKVMSQRYNSSYYDLPSLIRNVFLGEMSLNISESWAVERGVSTKFRQAFETLKQRFFGSGYNVANLLLDFDSANKAILKVNFTSVSGTGNYWGYYDLNFAIQPDGKIKFSLSPTQGTGTVYSNAAIEWVRNNSDPIITYLTASAFNMGWFPFNGFSGLEDFQKYPGFFVEGEPDNYFYGPRKSKSY